MVCAVRTLAGLLAGPHASDRFNQLRTDSHALAIETGTPDDQLRLTLMATALAGAYERGAVGRCEQLLQAGTSDLPVGAVELLAAIFTDLPRLPGALRRGLPGLFDAEDGARIGRAVAICDRCPELQRCRADARGRRGLSGVGPGSTTGPDSERTGTRSQALRVREILLSWTIQHLVGRAKTGCPVTTSATGGDHSKVAGSKQNTDPAKAAAGRVHVQRPPMSGLDGRALG